MPALIRFLCLGVFTLIISNLYSQSIEPQIIIPPYLQKGDTIALVAPSYKENVEDIQFALDWLQTNGFYVITGSCMNTGKSPIYCGSLEERITDFQQFLDNPSVKAIISTRGGYGCVKLLDSLDFTVFIQHPKWLCGFSDFTAFHSHINRQCRIATIHSIMPLSLRQDNCNLPTAQTLLKALKGEKLSYEVTPNKYNKKGTAEGELIGGNLSILNSIVGSPSEMNFDGKILLIEDCDEYDYHIDRMLTMLKRAGKLDHLAGIVVGSFVRIKKIKTESVYLGKSIEEIILDICGDYNYPIIFDAPVGHVKNNFAFRLGCQYKISDTNNCIIECLD